jgi:hypothetical protein
MMQQEDYEQVESLEDSEDEDERIVELRTNKNMRYLILNQQELQIYMKTLQCMKNELLENNGEAEKNKKQKKIRLIGSVTVDDNNISAITSWYNNIISTGTFSEANIENHDKTKKGKYITKILKSMRSESRRGKKTDITRVKVIAKLDPILSAFFAKTTEEIKVETQIARKHGRKIGFCDNNVYHIGELELIRLMQHEIDMEIVHMRQELLKSKLKAM